MQCWKLDLSIGFERIASWCLERRSVNRLMVTTRLDQDADAPTLLAPGVHESVLRTFGDKVVETFTASAWPGTELVGHSGQVYVVQFDTAVMARMVETQEDLSKWTQWNKPPLPEDVCLFLDGDTLPVLVSVTHEGDAWILSEDQVALPGVEACALSVDELLIPRGNHFCSTDP